MSLNLSTASLRALITLTEKREKLTRELAAIEVQISTALGEATSGSTKAIGRRGGLVGNTRSAKPSKRSGKRGKTKELILGALKEAGATGISVQDLSAKLGLKNQNVHVWFATTGEKLAGIEKTGKGIFRLTTTEEKIAVPVTEQPEKTKASKKGKRNSSTSKSKLTGKK